ncbi:tail fiber domain-containing protein [Caballeronia grimmiae]|uniref:Peptidase S74 domain-containing protein n=1 Tax=Caballeronia grimmiae TaxID=1071679 RepID=A0A069P2J4_9BURK|nr:tail fiber domain-containing protein [Caballeronia grimmiae]KDR34818.1 hypothetical protein BG57_03810 [Caballeronia grimmiae]GGD63471.1 hypothetical protein GCM10010985_16890 [Caballeronia grimmiae]
MANETVVKVGADASGYTAELEKARKSANAFINTQADMAKRTALAQDAIAEAAASGSDASARAVKSFTDALLKNASTAGKSRAEILAMRAANLGLSDSVKPYIDQIAKASEHTHSFSLESSAAKRELLVLGHELSQGNYKQFAGSLLVMAEATGAFNMLLNPVVLGVGAFVGVLAIAAHSTFAAREELATYGETVEKISKQTGLSTDDVQKFGFAAKTVGVETKDAADALADLTKAQNEAQHGNKDAAAAFSAVGISLKTLKTASPEDLLTRVADAFAKSADGAGKAAVANELFGTSGKNLIPLLDQGSARLAQLGATATEESALLDSDGTHAVGCLMRSRTNSDNETVAGNSTVNGNEAIGGTLGVNGAATFSSTVGIAGGANFGSAGQASISVAGAYSGPSAAYSGNVTVGGTLGVTGAQTFTGAATFNGAAYLLGSVTAFNCTQTANQYQGTGTQNGFHVEAGGLFVSQSVGVNAYLTKPSGYTNAAFLAFFVGGTGLGTIYASGTSVVYGTGSDYRLKYKVKALTGSTDRLRATRPVCYLMKADKSKVTHRGFIAHELQAIYPEAVGGEKDGKDMQVVDYGRITPDIVASTVEAHDRLDALTRRVEELTRALAAGSGK